MSGFSWNLGPESHCRFDWIPPAGTLLLSVGLIPGSSKAQRRFFQAVGLLSFGQVLLDRC
jgi:hypothetical protein